MYIYLTTNLINGKKYIGQSIKNPNNNTNYFGSGTYILKALKKYGRNNFKKEILKEDILSQIELDYWEKYFIKKFNAYESIEFYNASIGGNYGISWPNLSIEERKCITDKISISLKKYFSNQTLEEKIALSERFKKIIEIYSIQRKELCFKYFDSIKNILSIDNYKEVQLQIKRKKNYFLEWLDLLIEEERNSFFEQYNNLKQKSKRYGFDKLNKEVYQFSKEGIFIKKFNSSKEAMIELNNGKGNLTSVAQGKRNFALGFRWSYNEIPNKLIKTRKGRNKGVKDSTKRITNHQNYNEVEILRYDLELNLLNKFSSKVEAKEKLPELNISIGSLNHAINGRVKTYKGFIWKKGNKNKKTKYKN